MWNIKFYWGATECPGRLTFDEDGYWFKDVDDIDYHYIAHNEPKPTHWPIKGLYGVGFGRTFIGIMRLGKPT